MIDLTSRYHFLAVAVLFEGSLIGVAGLVGSLADVHPLAHFSWNARAAVLGAAAAVPLFLLFLAGYLFPRGPFRKIKAFLFESLGPSLAVCRWYDLLLVAAVAGIGEELLFRGVLHPLTGLWWSNVLFGVAHFVTPLYALLACAIGLGLGALFDATGNVLAPIVTHGVYDFLAFLVVAADYRRTQHGSDGQPAASQGG